MRYINNNGDIIDSETFRCIENPAVIIGLNNIILFVGDSDEAEKVYNTAVECLKGGFSTDNPTDKDISDLDSLTLLNISVTYSNLNADETVKLLNYLQSNLNKVDSKHLLSKDAITLKMLLAE